MQQFAAFTVSFGAADRFSQTPKECGGVPATGTPMTCSLWRFHLRIPSEPFNDGIRSSFRADWINKMATTKAVLTNSHEAENQQNHPSANPMLAQDSQALNTCSLPKNNTINTEKINGENHMLDPYETRCQKCREDLKTATGKALKSAYEREYKTWSNCKFRSKKLKGVTGIVWSPELDTFPGFLSVVMPIPSPDFSLDRIDPNFGYVVGNVRWADKQLQADNRRNVEIIMVNGVPMTKPDFAKILGITYDCLRMKLSRGDTIENIRAEYLKQEAIPAKSRKKTLAECPWQPLGEKDAADWEKAFKQDSLDAKNPIWSSRAGYFMRKSSENLAYYQDQLDSYKNRSQPILAECEKLINLVRYWQGLLNFAKNQAKLVQAEHNSPVRFNLCPTDEKLAATSPFQCYSNPSNDNGDEDDDDDEVIEHEDSYRRRYGNDCNDDE